MLLSDEKKSQLEIMAQQVLQSAAGINIFTLHQDAAIFDILPPQKKDYSQTAKLRTLQDEMT